MIIKFFTMNLTEFEETVFAKFDNLADSLEESIDSLSDSFYDNRKSVDDESDTVLLSVAKKTPPSKEKKTEALEMNKSGKSVLSFSIAGRN